MKCKFVKPDGEQCNANAMVGSDLCFSHNPRTREAKKIAVLRGGLAIKKNEEFLPPIRIRTTEDVLMVLEDTINQIRTRPMNHQKANCIGFLCNAMLKALEQNKVEKRLKNIQDVLSGR